MNEDFFLALASWCAMMGEIRKIGSLLSGRFGLKGRAILAPIGKNARTMDPHSTSMETHRARYRRTPDYHHVQFRQHD